MQKVHAKREYVDKQLCGGLVGKEDVWEHSRDMKRGGFCERGQWDHAVR